jgi:hypothetical protein
MNKNPFGMSDIQLRFARHYGTPEETRVIAEWDKAQTEKIAGFLGSWFIVLLFMIKLVVMTAVFGLLAGAPGLAAPVIGLVAFFLIRGMVRT